MKVYKSSIQLLLQEQSDPDIKLNETFPPQPF